MTITQLNFDWGFYFCMLALVTGWNLGLVAITREGKIGYPILKFFRREHDVPYYFGAEAIKEIDEKIRKMVADKRVASPRQEDEEKTQDMLDQLVKTFMDQDKFYAHESPSRIRYNIICNFANSYYGYKKQRVLPSYVTDPIITCITCMASFHSLHIYTAVILFKGFQWNPFEWAAIAIPCAFLGEFIWSLKSKIQQ